MNARNSVRYTEEMKGYITFGESDYERGAREGTKSGTRLMFHLPYDEPPSTLPEGLESLVDLGLGREWLDPPSAPLPGEASTPLLRSSRRSHTS